MNRDRRNKITRKNLQPLIKQWTLALWQWSVMTAKLQWKADMGIYDGGIRLTVPAPTNPSHHLETGQQTTCAHWCNTGGTQHHLSRTLAQNTKPVTALASSSIIHLQETAGWRNSSEDITRAKLGKPTRQATWFHQHMKYMQCAIPAWILIWINQLQKISWGQVGKTECRLGTK